MHELVGLLRVEEGALCRHRLAADEGEGVDEERHPEVLWRQPRPHQRVEQVGRRLELAVLAQPVESREGVMSYVTSALVWEG